MIEVLSPVGSGEALTAAVRAGADAVYLGARSFSARRNATNFDYQELIEGINYAHLYNVKVYLTVNIEVKDSEMAEVTELLRFLNEHGVDGIIVQDLGIASLIHESFPDLPLHGSTQMSVHHGSALPLLAKLGYKRIVTAREMSREELREFCRKAGEYGIEVEHFVHGALCMCVSGQCLLSSLIGQRSGNRGLCAQPCRLPFAAPGGTGHDLSLKDLSLFDYVREMEEMGVVSLKIEGRMKRPEYVALATYCCRQAVDGQPYDVDLLRGVFSRSGFTSGYYLGELGRQMFGIRTEEDEKASRESFNRIHELYRQERQEVADDLKVEIKKDQPVTVSAGQVTVSGEIPLPAQSRPTTLQDAYDSLSRLGNTPYYAEKVEGEVEDGLFVRASSLNQLRRMLVEKLSEEAIRLPQRRENPVTMPDQNAGHSLKKTYVRLFSPRQMPTVSTYDGLIIPISMEVPQTDKEIIVEIPRWIFNEKYISERLADYRQKGIAKAYCNSLSAVYLAQQAGLQVMGGSFLNITNSRSVSVLESLDVSECTLSCELSLKEISQLKSRINTGIISYGYLPLMLVRNCPLKNGRQCSQCDHKGYLTDRTAARFPVRCSFEMSELFNSTPIYLADRQDDIGNVDYQILYFTIESPEEVDRIISAYHDGIPGSGNYTRGLYYRSVL
ncbi:MAG: U32 family peptidase [Erysipelotrichaceae bacterium]|nr:U32 family peptidase [Erysipelotrichaceae bacterium]